LTCRAQRSDRVVEGGAHEIHRKAGRSDATSETFSLLVNVAGSAEILHDEHSALLEPGALSFVDGSQATALNLPAHYRQIIVQFPRDMICRRYPALIRNVSARLDADDANTSLFVQMSSATAARLPLLTHDARNHVFDAMAALLGALPCTASSRSTSERRLARAMADIDARLSDPELCPAALAGLQGISRRQLDNIFAEHGLSVERVIWDRRVDRAIRLRTERLSAVSRKPNWKLSTPPIGRRARQRALQHGTRDADLQRQHCTIRAQAEVPLLPKAVAFHEPHQRRALQALRELKRHRIRACPFGYDRTRLPGQWRARLAASLLDRHGRHGGRLQPQLDLGRRRQELLQLSARTPRLHRIACARARLDRLPQLGPRRADLKHELSLHALQARQLGGRETARLLGTRGRVTGVGGDRYRHRKTRGQDSGAPSS
jgi:AraC-like DNA-binding protein